MSQSRQLAAIMFTDIVGYTALMGEDEQAAFELLKKNRSVQRPIIEKYNGRWLKEIGDGVLASFSTVTDAVYCAGSIQKSCDSDPDLKLRIGIHLGEVVFDEGHGPTWRFAAVCRPDVTVIQLATHSARAARVPHVLRADVELGRAFAR